MVRLVRAMPPPPTVWSEPIAALDAGLWPIRFVDPDPALALLGLDRDHTNLPSSVTMGPIDVPHGPDFDSFSHGHRGGPPIHDVSCLRSPTSVCDLRVSGNLSADDIRRVVRRHHARFSFCYEDGLRRDGALAGTAAFDFVIGHDGSVVSVRTGQTDLPNAGVLACVARAFYGITFPAPGNGIVTVRYPVSFSPTR